MPSFRQSEHIKEQIIAAASDRFMNEGFSLVPIGEIATALGISKKTFYKHFASKDELVLLVMDRFLEEVRTEFLSIIESENTFLEKLESLVTFLGRRLTRLSRPVMRDLQRHSPEVWERVQRFRRERISRDFKGLLLRGVAEGVIRADVDIDLFLMAFIGAVEAVVNPAVLAEQTCSIQEIIRSIMTVFVRGILTKDALEEFALVQTRKTGNLNPQQPGAP